MYLDSICSIVVEMSHILSIYIYMYTHSIIYIYISFPITMLDAITNRRFDGMKSELTIVTDN